MKDFVVKDLERFLEIADMISTPFKFIEVSESDIGTDYKFVESKVWMRTAYVTFEDNVKKEELENLIIPLKKHGFSEAEIRETAISIK